MINVKVWTVVRELEVWLFAVHVGTLAMLDGRLTFCWLMAL
jgi:hypothetical protein